jgi:hypothetical protein
VDGVNGERGNPVWANLVFALLQTVFVIRRRSEYKIQGEYKIRPTRGMNVMEEGEIPAGKL